MKKFLFFASLSIVAAWPIPTSAQSQQSQPAASVMNRLFVQEASYQSGTKEATGQITFHPNGGKGTMDPVTNLSDGEELMLPRNTFVRDNYRFVGWTNLANGNEPIFQDEYPTFNYYAYNSDLYAVWEPASSALQLSFDPNGAAGTTEPIYVRSGQVILVPPHKFTYPEYGYECKGYGNTSDDYARYRIGSTASFTQSCKLYAIWTPLNGSIGGASEKFKGQTIFFDGVNIAPEDWVTIDKDSLYTYAEWHEGCGWYDTVQGWLNFCWAGAASNIIHWWLDQNKGYVDRFRETHEIPEFGYYGKGQSDVFAYFAKYWQKNDGNFSNIGFRWFINGMDGPLVQESARGHGGLFKDVFGDTDLVETYDYSGLNRRLFNTVVADALENHKAISIDESQMAGGHAITCWGFRFDENGYVDRLYYTDSATPWDNTLTKRDLSLSYITIKYDESQNWRVYMESAIKVNGVVEHGRLPIITVYSYSLGTELWEDYFTIEALGEYKLVCKDASGNTFDEITVKPSAEAQITLPSYPFRSAVRATVGNQELPIGNSHTISIADVETRTIVLEYNDNLPFKVTETANGQFVEPQWYQLCTTAGGTRYALQYDQDNNRLEGAVVADAPYEAQLWCLTGNMSDGFKLYNKQGGYDQALTYTSESGNAVLGTPEASTAVWTIAPASTADPENQSPGSFCLKASAGEGENIYLHVQNDEVLFTSTPDATSIWTAILYNGGTSSIEQPTLSPIAGDEEYYDLQGRRVKNPTRGIYVTKSGKKVLLFQQP